MVSQSDAISTEAVDELLAKCRSRCSDIWDNSGKYTHIKDRFGSDLTLQELKTACFHFYIDDPDSTIHLVGPNGWTCIR